MRFCVIVNLIVVMIYCMASAQDSLTDEEAFDQGAFDRAIADGDSSEEANKLVYQPGVQFVSEATGYLSPDDGSYGSDMRFFGKAYCKASKADIGSLFLSFNYRYFVFAAASNQFYRTFYQVQSPDPTRLSLTLSEFHFSFDIKKHVFIRVGNQLVSWGASFFWSPEDFVNRQKAQAEVISVVDVRSGKPGVRIHIPIRTVNIFLFTDLSGVVKNGSASHFGQSVAQAWRVDATVAGVNVGTVGYISGNDPAKIGFDATGNLLGADIYGECALTFTDALKASPDYAFSVGASKIFGSEKTWTSRAEYYHNGQGFKKTDISSLPHGSFTPFYSGKHYAYAEVSTTKFITQVLGMSFFSYANLADLSFATTLQVSCDFPGVLPFSVFVRYFGGGDDREFTSVFGGQALQVGFRIRGEF